MITCEFIGFFANNLFQRSAVLNLSKKHNVEHVFSKWPVRIKYNKNKDFPFYNSYHDIFLEKTNVNNELFKKTKWENYIYKNTEFKEIQYNKNTNLKIIGSFQSYKYFDEKLIKKHMVPKKDIKESIKNKYNFLKKENNVSLHIRRKDYIGKENFHTNLTNTEYYKDAIKLVKYDNLLIFSDDVEWCKKNINYKNSIFIENNADYIDFYLMSFCNTNIIANSTFSWWSAWINNNQNKKVIAPKKWFGPFFKEKKTKDLLPKEWIVI